MIVWIILFGAALAVLTIPPRLVGRLAGWLVAWLVRKRRGP